MLQSVSIPTAAEVVLSQGEFGFEQVLDKFPTASTVNILTFSVSTKKDDRLLRRLREIPPEAGVRIITNIPSKYGRTWDTIKRYLRQLEPAKLGPNAQVYYNYDNHAKVVATDEIAYLGSGNFSSPDSLECGLIVRGRVAVARIVDAIFPAAMRGARPHPTTKDQILGVWTGSVVARLKVHLGSIRELAEHIDERASGTTDYLGDPAGILLERLDELAEVLRRIADAVEESPGRYQFLDVPVSELRQLREALSGEEIREFLAHDGQRFVEAYVSDSLAPCIEAVQNDAAYYEEERRRELLQAADSSLSELESMVCRVSERLAHSCGVIGNFGEPPNEGDAVESR